MMKNVQVNVRVEWGDEGEVHVQEMHNLVVDTGLSLVRDLFVQKVGATKVDIISFGAGTTEPANDDTTMEDEVYTDDIVLDPVSADGADYAKVTYTHYLGSIAGSLGVISEVGLLSGPVLFARALLDSSINKTTTAYIKTTWEVTFQDVSSIVLVLS